MSLKTGKTPQTQKHGFLPRTTGGKPRPAARAHAVALAIALLLVGAAVLLGVLLAGSKDVGRPGRTALPVRPAASAAPAAAKVAARPAPGSPQGPERLRHGFRAGDLLRYAFSLERAVNLREVRAPGLAGNGAQSAGLNMSLSGIMTVRIYEELEDGWLAGFAFSEVKGRFQSPELEDPGELPPGALSGETVANLSGTGKIERLFLPEDAGAEERNFVRDLLASWQVVLPEDSPADAPVAEWTTTEDDTTGRYRARYSCRREEGHLEITKTKEEYEALRVHGQGDGEAERHVSGGAAIVIADRPARIEGQERVELRSVHFVEAIESELAYSFMLRSRDAAAFDAASVKGLLAARIATTIAASEKGREIGMPAASADIHDVLADVDAFLRRGIESGGLHELMLALVAALKSDPRAVEAVMDRLADPATGDDLASMLIGALGRAGTDPAQMGLERIITEKTWPENRQHMALFSLVQVESPRPGLDDTLRSVYEEGGPHAGNSLRLLGAVGNKLRAETPARAQALEEYLVHRLADPSLDVQGRLAALHALHNLAPQGTPAAVSYAYEAEDERVRRAAIQTLAGSHDAAAETLLRKAAEGDPSEAVRLAAVDVLALGGRDDASGMLTRMLLADPSESVRESALGALAKASLAEASVRETIRAVSERDRSQTVRERAAEILQGG